ncbi:rhodanese family domain-containing protein [Toxoplasma gondii GT1]|uniref:Rhodanese family domain-containing protein n=8 Tax=Toxoplasma gondii TaxID=5811 RepID=S7UTD1_TOXGG|nr:rhodanese family domain-containing protein [Toxoplasma gondii GT1]
MRFLQVEHDVEFTDIFEKLVQGLDEAVNKFENRQFVQLLVLHTDNEVKTRISEKTGAHHILYEKNASDEPEDFQETADELKRKLRMFLQKELLSVCRVPDAGVLGTARCDMKIDLHGDYHSEGITMFAPLACKHMFSNTDAPLRQTAAQVAETEKPLEGRKGRGCFSVDPYISAIFWQAEQSLAKAILSAPLYCLSKDSTQKRALGSGLSCQQSGDSELYVHPRLCESRHKTRFRDSRARQSKTPRSESVQRAREEASKNATGEACPAKALGDSNHFLETCKRSEGGWSVTGAFLLSVHRAYKGDFPVSGRMVLVHPLGLTALAAKYVCFLPSPGIFSSSFLLGCTRLFNSFAPVDGGSRLPPLSTAALPASSCRVVFRGWGRVPEARRLFPGAASGYREHGGKGGRRDRSTASRETECMQGSVAAVGASLKPSLCSWSPCFSIPPNANFPKIPLCLARKVSTNARGFSGSPQAVEGGRGSGGTSTPTGSAASGEKSPVSDVDRSFVQRLSEAGGASILDGKAFFLVDVREPAELQTLGCIPGAVNIPLGRLEEAFRMHAKCFEEEFHRPKPDPDVTIVVYCQRGVRSARGCEMLAHLGFQTLNYRGSYSDWSAALEAEKK